MTVYDITDPLNPKQAARLAGIGEGRQIQYYKGNLYVTARTNGLFVIDVSVPDQPRLRTQYDTVELATGICCADDIAYVCQRQFGTEFIDISDPNAPRHIGFVLSGEAQSVDYANGILYAGDWGNKELSVIDVRNKRNPKIIGTGKLDGLGDGVYVRGEYCYAATGVRTLRAIPAAGHGLDIFRVTDLRKPELVGRLKFPDQAVHTFPDFWSVAVNELGMAFVADTFNGLFCVDVSNPANPKCVAHSVLPTCERTGNPDPVASVEAIDGILYAAGAQNGVYVVEASGIAKPVSLERDCPKPNFDAPADLPMDANLVRDFSILPTTGQALAAAVWTDDKIWVAAGTQGLLLVDISTDCPRILTTVPTRGFAYDVKIANRSEKTGEARLYTAEGEAGAAIYQIKADGQLKLIGRYDSGQSVRQVVVPDSRRWMIAKSGNSNAYFLDISDPAAPRPVYIDRIQKGILYGRDFVDGTSPEGLVTLVAQGNGLFWYDLSKDVPERKAVSFAGQISFANGACWSDGLLYLFRYGVCRICDEGTIDSEADYTNVPVPGLSRYGKASAWGKTICFTNRREGLVSYIDVKDPKRPTIVRDYRLHGQPEIAVFANGRTILPAGHFGLLVEKKDSEKRK